MAEVSPPLDVDAIIEAAVAVAEVVGSAGVAIDEEETLRILAGTDASWSLRWRLKSKSTPFMLIVKLGENLEASTLMPSRSGLKLRDYSGKL